MSIEMHTTSVRRLDIASQLRDAIEHQRPTSETAFAVAGAHRLLERIGDLRRTFSDMREAPRR